MLGACQQHSKSLERTGLCLEHASNTRSRWRRTEQGLELAKTLEVAGEGQGKTWSRPAITEVAGEGQGKTWSRPAITEVAGGGQAKYDVGREVKRGVDQQHSKSLEEDRQNMT